MFVLKCPFQQKKLEVSSYYGSKVTRHQSWGKTQIFLGQIRKLLRPEWVKQILEKLNLAGFCIFCRNLRSKPYPWAFQSAAKQFSDLPLPNSGYSNDLFNLYCAKRLILDGQNEKIPHALQTTVAREPQKIEKKVALIKCSS